MLWLFLGPMSYLSMVYALLSMPAPTPTSSNITSESSFITGTTVTSGLSHSMNSSNALDSLTKITYRLSHPTCKFALVAAMPSRTSVWLLKQIHSYLSYLCDANSEIFLPNQFAAPAATIQAFVNGAIGVRLSS
jgi:hypothetical protein